LGFGDEESTVFKLEGIIQVPYILIIAFDDTNIWMNGDGTWKCFIFHIRKIGVIWYEYICLVGIVGYREFIHFTY